ncbi:MAG: sigma-70 family RNA polymerase sigma factor [Clostridiales bacterium]|nr:sigma-70 family RNA polymerase sigma factor [Clostridiales bacterium]
MGFNYAKEKMQFETEWKRLQKEYASAGMVPEDIESMRTYDWNVFLSRRNYENHTQPLPDTYLLGDSEDGRSPLFRKFASLTATFDEENFPGRYTWVDSIGNADLSLKLKAFSTKDLELLTFLVIEGHDQYELAKKWGCSQAAISQRFKKIKKFLK